MNFIDAVKTFPISFSAETVGDGLWGCEEGNKVEFTSVEVDITGTPDNDGWDLWGTIEVKHNLDAYEYGLLYTDSIEKAVEEYLVNHPVLSKYIASASGSEQGMQDQFILSMDISLPKGFKLGTLTEDGFEVNVSDMT